MAQDHPGEVAALLLPYAGQDGWPERLARVLNAVPLARSEPVVNLMIAFIDAGGFDAAVRDSARDRGSVFSLMHGFKGASAASGSRLVAAWLRRRLALLTADGDYGQPAGTAERAERRRRPPRALADQGRDGADPMPDVLDGQERVADAHRDVARGRGPPAARRQHERAGDPGRARRRRPGRVHPGRCCRLSARPPQRAAPGRAARTGNRTTPSGAAPAGIPVTAPTKPCSSGSRRLSGHAAGAGDPLAHAAVREMAGSALATEQFLAAAGFASGHPDLLGDAAAWLLSGPHALDQGWDGRRRGLSADVSGPGVHELPEEETRVVQERAAAHATSFEARSSGAVYGASAWQLLRDVPDADLTGAARAPQVRAQPQVLTPPASRPAPAVPWTSPYAPRSATPRSST